MKIRPGLNASRGDPLRLNERYFPWPTADGVTSAITR